MSGWQRQGAVQVNETGHRFHAVGDLYTVTHTRPDRPEATAKVHAYAVPANGGWDGPPYRIRLAIESSVGRWSNVVYDSAPGVFNDRSSAQRAARNVADNDCTPKIEWNGVAP